MSNRAYYREQLNKLSQDSNFSPSIKISGGLETTNFLDVNKESAPIIKEWLKQFEEFDLKRQLEMEVKKWVYSSFNFIHLDVVKTYLGSVNEDIIEHIRSVDHDKLDFIYDYDLSESLLSYVKENFDEDIKHIDSGNSESFEKEISFFIKEEHQDDFKKWQESKIDDNYPMWNTLFEFRNSEREEVIQASIDSGFGIIEGTDHFNQMLFVSGCGYSFYAQHWIPLYLNLPWNAGKRELYKGINYSDL